MNLLANFLKNDSGVTVVEYAMIAAVTALTLVIVMPAISDSVTGSYASVNDNLN